MEKHIPGYIKWANEFKNKGVDKIAVVSTNDAYVLAFWAKHMCSQDRLLFISDGNGKFTKVYTSRYVICSRILAIGYGADGGFESAYAWPEVQTVCRRRQRRRRKVYGCRLGSRS